MHLKAAFFVASEVKIKTGNLPTNTILVETKQSSQVRRKDCEIVEKEL